jgi:hypothetical protein
VRARRNRYHVVVGCGCGRPLSECCHAENSCGSSEYGTSGQKIVRSWWSIAVGTVRGLVRHTPARLEPPRIRISLPTGKYIVIPGKSTLTIIKPHGNGIRTATIVRELSGTARAANSRTTS